MSRLGGGGVGGGGGGVGSCSAERVLAASCVEFLRGQLAGGGEGPGAGVTLSSDARESLEVGVQCLESAYGLGEDDGGAVPKVDILKLVREHLAANTVPAEVKAEAERLKNEGNELMKADRYKDALDRYTKAIQLDSHNAVFFCNRAAAYFKLNILDCAVKDCTTALAIDPEYSKAHGRLGLALTSLDRHTEAKAAYARALQLEPDNESYRTNLRVTEERLAQQPQAGNGAGMDFGALLHNPALMNMATEMLSDPGMQNLISGLIGTTAQQTNQAGQGGGMNALLEAGQMLAQHMQQANPDLVDQLRRTMNQPPAPPGGPPQQ